MPFPYEFPFEFEAAAQAAVTTDAASDISHNALTGNLTIVTNDNCTRVGICYIQGTSGIPTVTDSVAYIDGFFPDGSYAVNITGLSGGTSYRIRAYAINSAGISYGDTITVLTEPSAPTGVSATDGTHTDKVAVSWTKSTGATGYRVYRDAVDVSGLLGDVDAYNDTNADAAVITPGTAAASDGLYSSKVALALSGQSIANGTSHTYTVTAVNATGEGPASSPDTGYRGHGALTYQWQRSAADSDAAYSNLSGATTATYNDTGAPANGDGRYYKCVLNATGAAQQISTADRGYKIHALKPRNVATIIFRSPAFATLSYGKDAWGINQGYRTNELGTLSFRLPIDTHSKADLVYPNEAWLYKDGVLKDEYKIMKVRKERQGGRTYFEVDCQQYGVVLTKDKTILSYSKAVSDGLNTTAILTALLAYQETARVTLGGVDVSLDSIIAIEITNQNIWEACKKVRDTVGGYISIEVDPADPTSRQLWLRADIGDNIGQQIRIGKNLVDITHETDYIDFCNRLYATGSSLLLSGKTYTQVTAVKSSDATYGYLTLAEQYAAYKGWTGLGDALPGAPNAVKIYKPGGSWANPSSVVSATNWVNPANGIDNNEATYTLHPAWYPNQWCDYYEVAIAATPSTQIKWYHGYYTVSGGAQQSYGVEVDIYYGAAWHNIYSGAPGNFEGWVTTSFAQQTITGVRIRYHHMTPISFGEYCLIKEIYVWNTTGYVEETAKFVQGGDEATVRCAIADYDAGAPYVISYTHADYLIDLDNITGHSTLAASWRDNIITGTQSFTAADADALLNLGRTKLAELTDPRISVDIGAIDLSVNEGRSWEELEMGDTVKIIDEDLDVDESQRIVRYEKPDLHTPDKVSLEVANKTKDIIDLI